MSLTVSQLDGWAPEFLPGAASSLRMTEQLLGELRQGVFRAVADMRWQSPAAEAARAAAGELADGLGALGQSFGLQAEAVARAGGALVTAKELLSRARQVAAEHDLLVLEDGDVTAPRPVLMSADAPVEDKRRVADALEAAAEARVRAGAMAREALTSAAEADRDGAAALEAGDSLGLLLARIAPGAEVYLGWLTPLEAFAVAERARLLDQVDARPVPAAGTDPFEVSAWWASLPATVRAALAASSPGRLGNLDGLPATVRDAANRARLAGERAALQAEVARLERRLDENLFGGHFTDDDAALGYARDKLVALDRLEQVLSQGQSVLLLLDTTGEQLRAAVARGDVDTAEHVAVFTGGLDSTVQGSLARYDRQMTALRRQADDFAARDDPSSVATVTWLGYEAPQRADIWRPSRSVAVSEAAVRGSQQLAAFYNGLDAARASSTHLIALGHSYGSLTTGLALRRGTGVDDVVFFGSPGIGTDDVRDLGLDPGRVFVVEARGDPVADFATFGTDPNRLSGVTGLSAAAETIDGKPYRESEGHSEYLHETTTSQFGLAAVIAGFPERAVRDGGGGAGDVARVVIPLLVPRVLP